MKVADLRERSVESRPTVKGTRHPHAAAAEEMCAWLSWLELGGASSNTLYTYGWNIDKLLALFPDLRFDEFTDVELLYALTTTTAKSRARWVAVFRSWFRWGVKTRRITTNPCDFLPDIKKPPQSVVEVFTEQEEAALRALPEPAGTLMAFMLDTGLRNSECRHLTGKRVDFERAQVIVIDGAKGGKQRIVPIDDDNAPGLLARLSQMFTLEGIGPDDHLWPIRPGGGQRLVRDKPQAGSRWHGWWVDCIADAGITYRKPHTTRHSFASRQRRYGVDMGDIQELLGHSSIATTQRIYVHTDVEDVRKRMAAARRAHTLAASLLAETDKV